MWKFVFVGKGKTTMGIMSKIFGTRSQREVKRLQPLVGQIEALGPACQLSFQFITLWILGTQ